MIPVHVAVEKNIKTAMGDSLMLQNKLGIINEIELSKEEERITKIKALELFDSNKINEFEVGTFKGLSQIHKYLFEDVYEFAAAMYLEDILLKIDKMPQNTFEDIIKKYIEMNVAHPFREGNGRSTRIWLDLILKKELNKVVDWSKVDKEEYLLAMERSPIKDTEIKLLIEKALTDKIKDREVYMKGIDASYQYEGYNTYTMKGIDTK